MDLTATQRKSSRQFRCTQCKRVVQPSIKGHTPLDRLSCNNCLSAKKNEEDDRSVLLLPSKNIVVPEGSSSAPIEISIQKQLLDGAPPSVKRMWCVTEEAFPPRSRRKVENPQRYMASDDALAIH